MVVQPFALESADTVSPRWRPPTTLALVLGPERTLTAVVAVMVVAALAEPGPTNPMAATADTAVAVSRCVSPV